MVRAQAGDPQGAALSHRARAGYLLTALGTIAIGLVVHRAPLPLTADVRDIAGDALWAMMMLWWVSALAPAVALRLRAALALAICWLVEFSQRFHAAPLDAVRATTLGHLVLGSGFDPRDLLAYALGIAVGVTLVARRGHSQTAGVGR